MRTFLSMDAFGSGTSIFRHLDPPTTQRELPLWSWPLVAALIITAGVVGVRLTPPGSQVAVWWPAAGIAVLFLLLTREGKRQRWAYALIFVSTTIANLAGGRPTLVAIAFGVCNTIEALVVLQVLQRYAVTRSRLGSLTSAIRFTAAVIAGAATIGVLAGITIAWLEGGMFWPSAGFVAASHAAAVFMITPFGLLPTSAATRARTPEMVAQMAALAATIAFVFNTSSDLPLAFLPYPVLAWAAFRFPIRVVITEALLASLAILFLTVAGGGPFNRDAFDVATRAALAETFLVTFAGFAVLLSAAQYELRDTARRLAATSRLLSGSLLEASVGLAIAEQHRNREITVVWSNPTAAALIRTDITGQWLGPIADVALEALLSSAPITVDLPDSRTLTIAANRIPDEPDRFAVQLIDVSEPLRMQAATLAAEREHEAARTTRADLERQRDDFVATTSHELRTPITSIIGYGELLGDSPSLPPLERSWVETITRNAGRLSSLVEDLLTFGKVQHGHSSVKPHKIDLTELVTEVLGNVRILADQRNITLTGISTSDSVYADRADVHRILENLVANAVKFTPHGGTVTVNTAIAENATSIAVTDTGPGMSPDALAHAFDRFYRAPHNKNEIVPGTGLGLAIVSELVARNKGTVQLTLPPAGGLTATVTLPIEETAQPIRRNAALRE